MKFATVRCPDCHCREWLGAVTMPARFTLHQAVPGSDSPQPGGEGRVPYQDAHLEAWFDGPGYSPQQRAAFRSTLEQLQAPDFLPSHGSVLGGLDGQVWGCDFPDPATRAADWTVYHPAPDGGAARWQVRLPPHLNALSAGDDDIVGVLRDEWGVETVRVYRVR